MCSAEHITGKGGMGPRRGGGSGSEGILSRLPLMIRISRAAVSHTYLISPMTWSTLVRLLLRSLAFFFGMISHLDLYLTVTASVLLLTGSQKPCYVANIDRV